MQQCTQAQGFDFAAAAARKPSTMAALTGNLRGLGRLSVALSRLGPALQQAAQESAAAAAAVGGTHAPAWPARPTPASQPWRVRAYTTPPVEAWASLRDSFSTIKADVGEDGVAVLTIDRPQALNALNSKVCSINFPLVFS
jgi:hypothetical protein